MFSASPTVDPPLDGGGDGRPQHGLRLNVLSELEERRRGLIALALAGFALGFFLGEIGHLGRQLTALDFLDIGRQGLFMQPMRRAIELLCRGFEPVAKRVVYFDTQSDIGHDR